MPGILFLQDFPIVFEAVLLSVLALDKNPILPFAVVHDLAVLQALNFQMSYP